MCVMHFSMQETSISSPMSMDLKKLTGSNLSSNSRHDTPPPWGERGTQTKILVWNWRSIYVFMGFGVGGWHLGQDTTTQTLKKGKNMPEGKKVIECWCPTVLEDDTSETTPAPCSILLPPRDSRGFIPAPSDSVSSFQETASSSGPSPYWHFNFVGWEFSSW